MRYANIISFDICNGEGIGVSLFVQGCHFHCKNCFNKDTWDFNGGKEWTPKAEEEFLKLIDRPFIKRVSFLGGEPLASQNLNEILCLVNQIRLLYPKKIIWFYTGFKLEDISFCRAMNQYVNGEIDCENAFDTEYDNLLRNIIVSQVDVLVDGRYEEDKKDATLKFRGSSNQRVIDIKKSLEQNEVVLWCD